MKFINKLERKFGRYAIHNLIHYVIMLYVLGTFLMFISPEFYYQYLILDIGRVLKGEIWRLVTFIIPPYYLGNGMQIIFLALEMYLYYMIGRSLENSWGAFRFNLYYISGVLFNIVAAVIIYFAFGMPYFSGLTYINRSLFFAFAALYPNVQFLIFYIIPVKVKWLGYLYGAVVAYDVLVCIRTGDFASAIAIVVALANFLIFFLATRNYKKISPKEYKRKVTYKREVNKAAGATRHKCSVCGKTELDDENLEFRFCSKCEGNYEYCTEHLFTHEHVHKH